MTRHVLLNNVDHKDLKVITRFSPEFGDDVNAVPTFPTEFGDIQREYPILFRQDRESGAFQSVALLGFENGENLFLENDRWNAGYVPGIIARGPFLIGFQQQEIDGELRREPVIHVDMDDPRVNEIEGEPVFLEHGGNTPYLQYVANILRGIQEGMGLSAAMFSALQACDVIEPVNIDVDVYRDVRVRLKGFYTVSRERLARLGGAALQELNAAGFLEGAFLVLASLNNVPKLIEMKNRRLPAQ
ncbi:MAG: SapC family protein [Woeseiaceae bacterium]